MHFEIVFGHDGYPVQERRLDRVLPGPERKRKFMGLIGPRRGGNWNSRKPEVAVLET